jgi:hypothetical protein
MNLIQDSNRAQEEKSLKFDTAETKRKHGIATRIPKLLRVCLLGKKYVKSYCSTFRCYLTKFVQP